jgi:hypothetical protein
MDAVSFPSQSYTPVGVPSAEPAAPTPSAAAPSPASVVPAVAPQQAPPEPGTDEFVPDFSHGVAGGYVLDWRDSATHAIVVQLPMRTALSQFAGIPSGATVGSKVDTEA